MSRRPVPSFASPLPVLSLWALGILGGVAFGARSAQAQGIPGPSIPVATDLADVVPGAWAEYAVSAAQLPPMKQRFALVAKDADSETMELTSEGGMVAVAGGKMTLKMVLNADPKAPNRVRQLVMQFASYDPMEMPNTANIPKSQFAKIDPKKFVKAQPIKVPAGSFKTKLYRDETAAGTIQYWMSDEVLPIGLVKMEVKAKPGAGGPAGTMAIELARQGKDARPTVVKPARPFDPTVLQGQMQSAAGEPSRGK